MTNNKKMEREMQIHSLKRIFQALNLGADLQEIDFEHYLDSQLSLPENIQIMRSVYPQFRWSREDITEEQENPEIRRIRERENELRKIKKERGEAFAHIERTEKDVRDVVKKELDKEIETLRADLEMLIKERSKISTSSPEEVSTMRRDVERIDRRIHEMDILLMQTYKRVTGEKRERRIEPQAETIGPIRRKCVGEIVTGYVSTGKTYFSGQDVKQILSRPCTNEVYIENPELEAKFLQLAIRAHRLGPGQAAKIRNLCPSCQISQYNNTIGGMVCEDVQKGIISAQMISGVGIRVNDFINVCKRHGYDVRQADLY